MLFRFGTFLKEVLPLLLAGGIEILVLQPQPVLCLPYLAAAVGNVLDKLLSDGRSISIQVRGADFAGRPDKASAIAQTVDRLGHFAYKRASVLCKGNSTFSKVALAGASSNV